MKDAENYYESIVAETNKLIKIDPDKTFTHVGGYVKDEGHDLRINLCFHLPDESYGWVRCRVSKPAIAALEDDVRPDSVAEFLYSNAKYSMRPLRVVKFPDGFSEVVPA